MSSLFSHKFSSIALLCLVFGATPSLAQERVISLNGSLTEIVYALKQESLLVGVDTTSQFPPEATELSSVGYQRALSAEGILSLQPTLILSTNHAGPETALQQINSLGVERITLQEQYSIESVIEKIQDVAEALQQDEAGQALAKQTLQDFKQVQARIPSDTAKPRVLFFLGTGNASPSVAGGNTAAAAMIELAGGDNPFGNQFEGYKAVNAESMIAAAPDVLFVSSRSFDSVGGLSGVLSLPGVAATPAGQNKRIYSVDTLLTLGFGPRTPLAIASLLEHLYPPEKTIAP